MSAAPHIPVLLAEVLAALALKPGDLYVDATRGAGGYLRAARAQDLGHAYGFDRDPEAHALNADIARADDVTLIRRPFSEMVEGLADQGVSAVDAIAFDIGVSSMQIDTAERGFSFQADGPLDMRMSQEGMSAADFINSASEEEIADVLFHLGDERASRRIARAIVAEVKSGRGSEHGGAYLDIASRLPAADIKKKLPSMYHQFMSLGNLDITTTPMEVGPTCHYVMGGIRVHPETQESRVPGLFAAGECAGGLHGSNRLGGNSLSDLLVFGRRAGLYAAEHVQKRGAMPMIADAEVERLVEEMYAPFKRAKGENAFNITSELQDSMEANVGIARIEDELKLAVSNLEGFKPRAEKVGVSGDKRFNPGWHQALALDFMLVCSEAIAKCALERRESRGGHMRVDFQDTLDEFGQFNHVVWRGEDGRMQLRREPLPQMPPELAKLIEEKK